MIARETLEQAAYRIMCQAGIEIPDDYRQGIEQMAGAESGPLSCFVLETMLDNWRVAKQDRRPMCADTGVPRYYVKVGNEARLEGGFIALEEALRRATAQATHDVPLRPNRVHPLYPRGQQQQRRRQRP